MGKIYDGLSKMIMAAMKDKDAIRVQALKNIKSKMIEFKTSKDGIKVCTVDANGERVIPDASEINIIKKIAKELAGDIEVAQNAGREDIVIEASGELAVVKEFIPAEPTEADIRKIIDTYLSDNNLEKIEQKQMGLVIKHVKAVLPNADGAMVSGIVRTYIG